MTEGQHNRLRQGMTDHITDGSAACLSAVAIQITGFVLYFKCDKAWRGMRVAVQDLQDFPREDDRWRFCIPHTPPSHLGI